MRAIIQRVNQAHLRCIEKEVQINRGMLPLVGVERGDNQPCISRMAERLLTYRIFPDSDGRMNLSLKDIDGDLLLVPNFTVAANTRKGTRAGFSTAATPIDGERIFLELASTLGKLHPRLHTGHFGADMQINLTNDGPVTFILES